MVIYYAYNYLCIYYFTVCFTERNLEMDQHPWLGVIIIFALTVIAYFLELAKAAFENVNDATLEKLADDEEDNPEQAAAAEEALEFIDGKERGFLNAVRASMGIALIVNGIAFAKNVLPAIVEFTYTKTDSKPLVILIAVVIAFLFIYLVVLFSHIIPDRLGSLKAERYFFKMFGLMKAVTVVMTPISAMLEGGCKLGLKLIGVDASAEDIVTEDEIISMVNESQEQGVLDDDEAEMISNIIEFDEKQTQDIMTHRTRIIAVDSEMGIEEAMRFMAGQSFSRFPLYTGDIDNIVGVIHLKDVVKCFASNNYKDKTLIDIARKPLFVPDTQNIDDLFKDMQEKNVHMAIAIDEYGQTAGIVAMEDILEEIVGNIQDEFDREEEQIRKCKENIWLVLGDTHLDELAEETGLEPKDDDLESFDTLNGLLISILDRIPMDGEKATVTYQDYRFDIIETKNKMIRKVRMTKLNTEPADKDAKEE